jgi:hypothetical protein
VNVIKVNEQGTVMFQVVVVGVGGNGSHFVRTMLQTISAFESSPAADNVYFDVTLVDADKVEKKNFQRQLYDHDDLDEYKVVALADRYADYYGVNVKTVSEFVTSLEMLEALFGDGDMNIGKNVQVVPVLFGLVDNNKTRQLIDEFFHSDLLDSFFWIDAGIEGVMEFEEPSLVEQQMIEMSGFGGQVVCGFRHKGETILEPVTQVYRNILEDEKSFFPGQSCGDAIVNNPQRLATNQMAAQVSGTFLNNLLHNFSIYYHKVNFNVQFAQSKPTFIQREAVERYEAIKKEK